MPRRAKPKPPSYLVHTISLDRDPADKLLTWATFETPSGVFQAALSRDAIENLWGMLDTLMTGWSCDCIDCTAERLLEEAEAAGAIAASSARVH